MSCVGVVLVSLLCLARCNEGEEGRAGVGVKVAGNTASCWHCIRMQGQESGSGLGHGS